MARLFSPDDFYTSLRRVLIGLLNFGSLVNLSKPGEARYNTLFLQILSLSEAFLIDFQRLPIVNPYKNPINKHSAGGVLTELKNPG
jgi:hypothetical protein